GALSVAFAFTPYSGDILLGSIVCYDADEKCEILKVPQDLIDTYTPESAEVTAEMAKNAKKLFSKADIVVAVTGLTKACGSETKEGPAGTLMVNFIVPDTHLQVQEVSYGESHLRVHQTT